MRRRSKVLVSVLTVSALGLATAGSVVAAGSSSGGLAEGDEGARATPLVAGEEYHAIRLLAYPGPVAAEFLGLEYEEFRAQRQAGLTPAQIASDAGVDPAAMEAYVVEELSEVIDALAAEGRISPERQAAMLARLPERVGVWSDTGAPVFPAVSRHLRLIRQSAAVIGIGADALVEALVAGDTIASVAAANGSSGQAVIDTLVSAVQAHLSERVASGAITQEQADRRLARASAWITERVNEPWPMGTAVVL